MYCGFGMQGYKVYELETGDNVHNGGDLSGINPDASPQGPGARWFFLCAFINIIGLRFTLRFVLLFYTNSILVIWMLGSILLT
jgi:hypothetical protein